MIKSIVSKGSRLLRAAFLSGLMLLVILGGGLVFLYTSIGLDAFRAVREEIGFHQLLSDYDFRYRQVLGDGRIAVGYQQLDSLSRDLDHLETRAEAVENWLSVLSRRRRLADHAGAIPGAGLSYLEMYRRTARRAFEVFPFSEPIAAVAASAIVRGAAITGEMEDELRGILPVLRSAPFVPMRLSLHVLLGDFNSPERAAANLLEDGGLSLDFAISALGQETEAILAGLVILRILEGQTWEALSAIQSAMTGGRASPAFIRFAAEFLYDFGSPIRSAELFHMLPGRDALSRQADALWLGDYAEHARLIWASLAASGAESPAGAWGDEALENRALYNLAATSTSREDAGELLERLVRQGYPGSAYREMGLVRLSRLMDAPAAVALLEAEREAPRASGVSPAGSAGDFPLSALVDLEILRRRMGIGESARIVAETWMLLHRYPETEGLFQWAAWYFGLQRNFVETDVLLRTAERHGFSGRWMGMYGALQMIREGRLDAAIGTMDALQAESADWALAANLGRIFEARNASARALEHYQMALALLMEDESLAEGRYETASLLQFRIARSLRTLGRMDESRRALLVALEFNPNNLSARLELGRM